MAATGLKFQPPQGMDTTSPNEAFNKGLGNLRDPLTIYSQLKMQAMENQIKQKELDRQLKESDFNMGAKATELGLKQDELALGQKREERMGNYQAELLDIRERLAALAERTGETRAQAAEDKRGKEQAKQEAMQGAAVKQADRIIGKVDEAVGLIGGTSTGFGALLKGVPATKAKALDATLKTIKANIGFSELQAMRQASPTGGALGQVAVQELDALQATISALDQDQDPALLKKNLEQVRTHFLNWKNAVTKAQEEGTGEDLGSEDAQALEWANAHPDDPRAAKIKKRLGR